MSINIPGFPYREFVYCHCTSERIMCVLCLSFCYCIGMCACSVTAFVYCVYFNECNDPVFTSLWLSYLRTVEQLGSDNTRQRTSVSLRVSHLFYPYCHTFERMMSRINGSDFNIFA